MQEIYEPGDNGVPTKCGFNSGFLHSSTSHDAVFNSGGVDLSQSEEKECMLQSLILHNLECLFC